MAKKNEKIIIDLDEEMKGKTRCSDCGKILVNSNFYVSNSRVNKYTGRVCTCKSCITNLLVSYLEETDDVKLSIYNTCRAMDFVYLGNILESSLQEAGWNKNFTIVQNGLEVWKKYIKTINSLKNYKGYSFEQGEQLNLNPESEVEDSNKEINSIFDEDDLERKITDKKNKEDIIRIVGYDPFANEKENDKSYLYARLVDIIDESMQEDNMKLTSVISIIKTQKQVDKLDDTISELMSDPLQICQRAGDIKSLTSTKKDLQKSALDTAKDNRITELYSGQKTTGANTLSGTVKKLKEINLAEAQVNLYDIQTSLGMQQVAYQSDKAIVDQLIFAENEYADMVAWQRGQVQYYEKIYKQLTEENRKLKVLCNSNNIDYKKEAFIDTYYEEELKYDEETIEKVKREKEEFEEIVKSVLPLNTIKYAEKVIEENEKIEKQKIIDSVKIK